MIYHILVCQKDAKDAGPRNRVGEKISHRLRMQKGDYVMGKNFRETLNEQMKNPEFKEEWDASEPEYQIIKAMLNSRIEKSLTQQQLSEITGIPQADISRLENGNANPSLRTLQRLAEGMGMKLKLEFVPANR